MGEIFDFRIQISLYVIQSAAKNRFCDSSILQYFSPSDISNEMAQTIWNRAKRMTSFDFSYLKTISLPFVDCFHMKIPDIICGVILQCICRFPEGIAFILGKSYPHFLIDIGLIDILFLPPTVCKFSIV